MSEKNIVYLEVCYGKTNSICIHATKKSKKPINPYKYTDFESLIHYLRKLQNI
mgnify:CR=1 FL=1